MTLDEKVALVKESGVWDEIGYPKCIEKLIDLVADHECEKLSKIILNDSYAMTFQTFGQYRTAIIDILREAK